MPLFALETGLPLPSDTLKIYEKTSESGLKKSLIRKYESSWDKKKIISFYKKELAKIGWIDKGNDFFVKDDNMIVIQIKARKNGKGKTGFLLITSKISTKEEALATRKKNPDKLKFMPVYPGSEQLRLWELPNINGVTGIYKAEGSVREIVFFYKSRMLNYGWVLSSERLVKGQTNLIFTKTQNDVTEKCEIKIAESQPGRIVISATYNEHKKRFKYKK